MEDIPLLDQSTLTASDKLCFMILDHLKRQEDAFEDFRNEYINAKRFKKYTRIMKAAYTFLDHELDGTYIVKYKHNKGHIYDERRFDFMVHGPETQIAVSMCIKNLSNDRINEVWNKIFPDHIIADVLEQYNDTDVDEHIIWGYNYKLPGTYKDAIDKKVYEDDDIKKLLNELTLKEIASIHPEIKVVTYRHIEI